MQQPAPGILLIADPFLKDPNFMRSVVLLCEHKDEGTFGFVLNKAYEYSLDELVNGVEDLQLPVYMGGPVQMDTIHFLHQYPDDIPGSFKIVDGLYWGGDFETAIAAIRSGAIDAGGIRFFIGYSGWGSGQLGTELDEKTWLTAEATAGLVFHRQAGEIWKDALRHLGGEYEMMVNFPIDPQLN
jgi:putative transcriptional regulator